MEVAALTIGGFLVGALASGIVQVVLSHHDRAIAARAIARLLYWSLDSAYAAFLVTMESK